MDKSSAVVVLDREDYLKEAGKQLDDNDVYEDLETNAVSSLEKVIMHYFNKVKIKGDVCQETLNYFLVNNPILERIYLLPKIHKGLHDVPGRPVLSNSGYYTENISHS